MEKKKGNTAFKNNVETGASSAVGAAAGVILGSVVSPVEAQAQEVPTPQLIPEPVPVVPVPEPMPEPTPEPEPIIPEPEPTPEPEPEVEVVAYERLTDGVGNQADLAVVIVDGTEIGILDANLDGEADLLMADLNQNGVIEEDECEVIQGQGLSMKPLQDATGFSPLYAQNDLPDYVNDADVDTYMA